jgi:thiamine biosynthesis lipoprotein
MQKSNPKSGYPNNLDRRYFLKLSGLLGVGIASGGILTTPAEAVKFNRRMYKVSRTRLAMGTFVSMTLIHPSRERAEEAIGAACAEMDRLSGSLNRFDRSTAVGRLNSDGLLKDAPPEVGEVVAKALKYYRLSHGTFDVTVKPVVDLYKASFAGDRKTPPGDKSLRRAMSLVGADKLRVNGRAIHFRKPGMGITLDGIAKGYIVDRAAQVLADLGVKNFLINAGGDIRTRGARQDRKPWRVAVQDPQKKRRYPDIIEMNTGAVATSGNYEVYFDREKIFHHIVDPRDGLSPALSASVSVRAKTAMDADALSTAVFVMDPAPGIRFINSLPRCESLVVDKNGKLYASAGWKRTTT